MRMFYRVRLRLYICQRPSCFIQLLQRTKKITPFIFRYTQFQKYNQLANHIYIYAIVEIYMKYCLKFYIKVLSWYMAGHSQGNHSYDFIFHWSILMVISWSRTESVTSYYFKITISMATVEQMNSFWIQMDAWLMQFRLTAAF